MKKCVNNEVILRAENRFDIVVLLQRWLRKAHLCINVIVLDHATMAFTSMQRTNPTNGQETPLDLNCSVGATPVFVPHRVGVRGTVAATGQTVELRDRKIQMVDIGFHQS